ncbi:hypothetical protein [Candidatus Reidiella endopervernicosa]|uniref:hypothetical protein n=1 Tax=Candidatus Reidiella endopervernicosa TaxID=2738883 RepID=UPI001F1DB713|nr:hypothetical protein [Candidatus Reidiella endopervernicosa]
MKLARYWAKESRNSNTGQGQEYELACWRGSNESEADAQARAVEAVERLVARVKQGEPLERYDYSEGYIREELIEEINSAEGELIGVVTRNRYGALVLNCERVLFADIDIEPPGLIDKLKALFGGRVKDRNYHLQQIESYASEQPGIALAVYETLAGLRVVPGVICSRCKPITARSMRPWWACCWPTPIPIESHSGAVQMVIAICSPMGVVQSCWIVVVVPN